MFVANATLAFSLLLTTWECIRFVRSRRAGRPASVVGLVILLLLNGIALTFYALIVAQRGFNLN